jgi:hypothetical protein
MKKVVAKSKKPVIKLSVSVNGNQAEPMRLLGNHTELPEAGDVVKVLPDRLKSTVFARKRQENVPRHDWILARIQTESWFAIGRVPRFRL